MPSKWKSRKLWMSVVGALIVIANEGLGLNLPSEAIKSLAAIVIAYLLAEGAVDALRAVRR